MGASLAREQASLPFAYARQPALDAAPEPAGAAGSAEHAERASEAAATAAAAAGTLPDAHTAVANATHQQQQQQQHQHQQQDGAAGRASGRSVPGLAPLTAAALEDRMAALGLAPASVAAPLSATPAGASAPAAVHRSNSNNSSRSGRFSTPSSAAASAPAAAPAAASAALSAALGALPHPVLDASRLAVINSNPAHRLDALGAALADHDDVFGTMAWQGATGGHAAAGGGVLSELDRDQELLDTLPLILPQLADSFEFEAKYAEERLARDPTVETLTFGQLQSLTVIGACSQSLIRVSRHIGLLFNTTTLQLCCNQLTEIPAEIGYLKNLTSLSVGNNRLTSLPDTIGLLTKLVELKANDNLLTSIPVTIAALTKLTTLSLEQNQISSLPPEIVALKSLVSIDVSHNPLDYLPAEIGRLKELRRIGCTDCPMVAIPSSGPPVLPSLKELAARTIVRLQLPILSITQPEIKDYLASAHQCSFCGGPYFETYTTHVRIVDRSGVALPLQYRLCVKHWANDQERIASLFGPRPRTAPSPIPSVFSTPLPTPPDSPEHGRRRKRTSSASSLSSSSFSAALPLSSIVKSPSLPSLPVPPESRERKQSASQLIRKTLIASGLRASRSLSFLPMPGSSSAGNAGANAMGNNAHAGNVAANGMQAQF